MADGLSTAINVGVYGRAYGFGSTTPANKFGGYFDGDIMVNGEGYKTSAGDWAASDSLLKNDINAIDGILALKMVKQLSPSTYYFDTLQYSYLNF